MSSILRCVTCALFSAGVLLAPAGAPAQYDPPAGFYDTATGTGAALKAQLNAIIDGSTSNYSDREQWLEVIDQDPANSSNILLVYTGGSVAKTEFPSGSANTEHLWPNSYGIDDGAPAYGDLFNLRACVVNINSDRANKFYDVGGSPVSGAPLCRIDADSWEPRDIEKGDLARSMFYMDTRYEGDSSDGFARDLVLTENTSLISSTASYMGKLSVLVDWHFRDSVSLDERARNHAIYTSCPQHNRNPYIDHPEFVWAVFGSGANNSRLYLGVTSPGDGASTVNLTYRLIKGSTPPAESLALNKTGTCPTTYDVTTAGSLLSSSVGSGRAFVGGMAARSIQVALDSTTSPGQRSGTLTLDNSDLTTAGAGLGSADGNDLINMTAAVLEHSNGSFSPSADQDTLTIDFGTVYALSGQHTQAFAIHNLMPVANYTAGLDLDTVTATGHTSVLSTDLAPTVNLTAGQARSFAATLRTNTVGTWQAVVALAVSDEDVPGATAGSPLTLTLKGAVVPAIVPPDFNTDGDVDADDFEVFAACISGPSVSATGGCDSADFDGDGDVDQDDFGIFQHCFSGRDLPPYPDCAV